MLKTCRQLGPRLTFQMSSNLSIFARGLLSYAAHKVLSRSWIISFPFISNNTVFQGIKNHKHNCILPMYAKIAPHRGTRLTIKPGKKIWPLVRWFWFYLRTQEAFYRSFTIVLSLNGHNWGLWILGWYPCIYILTFSYLCMSPSRHQIDLPNELNFVNIF